MLEECAQLRGHVVAGLRENENMARLLDGATRTEVPDEAAGTDGRSPAGTSPLGGGQR